MRADDEDKTIYRLLVNHEEQYCIWAARRPIPLGWHDVGKKPGLKSEILAFVKEVWTDMRPLSVRKRLKELGDQETTLSTPEVLPVIEESA